MRGIVVTRRQSLHGAETAHARVVDRSLRSARYDKVGLAPADEVHGIDHRVIGRCAGRDGAVVRTHEAVFDGYESRGEVRHHAGNEKRAESRDAVSLDVALALFVERGRSTGTRTPHDTGPFGIDGIGRCVANRFVGGYHGILREEVVFAHLLAVEVAGSIVLFYFASETGSEFRGVEARYRSRSAHPVFEISEILFHRMSRRVDRAYARNDDSLSCHKNRRPRAVRIIMVSKLFLVRLHVCDSVAYGGDLLGVLVGDLDVERFLKLHDQLHGVERIRAQMSGETCFGYYLRLLNAQLVNDDLDNF